MFISVKNTEELLKIIQDSNWYYFIYKHSATCPTAILAKRQVEQFLETVPDTNIIYIHVRDQRDLSDWVAEYFDIEHESPQLITFLDGKVIEVKSHGEVTEQYIKKILNK